MRATVIGAGIAGQGEKNRAVIFFNGGNSSTRGTTTRATPDTFPFLTDPQASGRVPEGALLSNAVKLGWAELIAT